MTMEFDGVELVIALEETFGMEMSDEEVDAMVTPRIAGDLIFAKLKSTD